MVAHPPRVAGGLLSCALRYITVPLTRRVFMNISRVSWLGIPPRYVYTYTRASRIRSSTFRTDSPTRPRIGRRPRPVPFRPANFRSLKTKCNKQTQKKITVTKGSLLTFRLGRARKTGRRRRASGMFCFGPVFGCCFFFHESLFFAPRTEREETGRRYYYVCVFLFRRLWCMFSGIENYDRRKNLRRRGALSCLRRNVLFSIVFPNVVFNGSDSYSAFRATTRWSCRRRVTFVLNSDD